jgi:hypothetical protein
LWTRDINPKAVVDAIYKRDNYYALKKYTIVAKPSNIIFFRPKVYNLLDINGVKRRPANSKVLKHMINLNLKSYLKTIPT